MGEESYGIAGCEHAVIRLAGPGVNRYCRYELSRKHPCLSAAGGSGNKPLLPTSLQVLLNMGNYPIKKNNRYMLSETV